MDKSMLVYLLLGVVFVYTITNLSKIADENKDDNLAVNSYYRMSYDRYEGVNDVGETIVNFSALSETKQIEAWSGHPLNKEWMRLFPDFSAMEAFIDERVKGETLPVTLKNILGKIEKKYFSGAINLDQAKQRLGTLK